MVDRFERFSYALFEISRCWHKLAAEEMAKYDLKGPYIVYLTAIHRNEGITAAQLCEVCGRDKADVSRAISVMEQIGLVRRENADGKQYRAQLMLTPKGHEAALHLYHRASLAVELASQGYSDADRAVFWQVLDTVATNLHELSKQGLPDQADGGNV